MAMTLTIYGSLAVLNVAIDHAVVAKKCTTPNSGQGKK
jgi:hypothetical protein